MMNIQDSGSVKTCWTKIKAERGADSFVDDFYHLMFKHHPETRELFPDTLLSQKTSLLATLDNVINGIDYIEELETELITLGKRHKDIGIEKDMFDVFITTIIDTANIASNQTLTDKELVAWEEAFRKVANLMLKAYS
ncbi:MAG TPA: globin [Gammaproteobacteria bacterium]|nr:globin [Gammaproteobacteria bacterium]